MAPKNKNVPAHVAQKSVSVGEHGVIIVLVVSLMLHGEAVGQVRIPHVLVCIIATTTHTNLHSSSITY